MPRLNYALGYLYCSKCKKHFKQEECPLYQSITQKYPICPTCPEKWRLRKRPHNKRWFVYYNRVTKPQFEKDKEIIVKYKWDHPRKRFYPPKKKEEEEDKKKV